MSCDSCGKCCKIITLHPSWFEYDLQWMLLRRGKICGDVAVFYSPCEWINEEGKCKNYENRPAFCRTNPKEESVFLKALGCKFFEKPVDPNADLSVYRCECVGALGRLGGR